MKSLAIALLLSITAFAAVTITFDAPVTCGEVKVDYDRINYIYTYDDQLVAYTQYCGSITMCYPDTSEASPDTTIAAWESEVRAATCPIQFTPEEVTQPAFQFIKQTVPARVKTYLQGETP